ncbi:hypothetical protein K435DRAFT_775949 [Dendrothele bispora CBS 962.96]|uniref:Uncharacterized protein n=1 Tax=Dendrothele bispora (strain CBS 962.96) TaxID=1314807 RepID=A0A4S8MAX2_DENBC|nr:hypothetical protein K435DRAFT_777044 [Dendrothele bispora CBS 962.96]THV01725.1 hypothetical protein K435DRAFT_775949 [Dendrothele bispora CBS 962.96]
MSATYTPLNAVDMTKEKDWPVSLGILDWDDTSIVFTKRSLIEFLKYTGITVDTNFANVQKLPRYAKFGKLSFTETQVDVADNNPNSSSTSNVDDAFKPSRRVRTAPGGDHTDIFGADFQAEEDALSTAPPKNGPTPTSTPQEKEQVEEEEPSGIAFSSEFKPTRRVRTTPGGNSSIGSLWDDVPTEDFKPTRRVRQGPGGQDNISDLW